MRAIAVIPPIHNGPIYNIVTIPPPNNARPQSLWFLGFLEFGPVA